MALEGNPLVTMDRTSFSDAARLSTRSKPLFLMKTAGQQPGSGLETVNDLNSKFFSVT